MLNILDRVRPDMPLHVEQAVLDGVAARLGDANPDLHEIANWTEGCVALTNEQIDQLKTHVYIGMPVIIR